MHRRTALVLPAAVLGGALASGFPVRVGLTRSEAAVSLPGDLLLPGATVVADRSLLVGAPPERIWPWLTQIGQDRGGFYSWTALENAMGCQVEDVRELRGEWSSRKVGEPVHLAPGMSLRVALSSENDALVLTTRDGQVPDGHEDSPAMDFEFTWTFALLPEAGGATRVHVRERYLPHSRVAEVTCRATLVGSALMSMRMLRGIKDLAEAS